MRIRAAVIFVMAMSIDHVAWPSQDGGSKTATWNEDEGGYASAPVVTLSIRFDEHSGLDDRLVDAAFDEARALWAPYRVTLVRSVGGDPDPCLTITVEPDPLPTGPRTTGMLKLGSIEFARNGQPTQHVRVSVQSIVELFSEHESTAYEHHMPQALWNQILARAIGRVVAHEIGHFLLRFPAHAPAGLMASRHSTVELAGTDRRPFALTTLLEGRLRERLRAEDCRCQ